MDEKELDKLADEVMNDINHELQQIHILKEKLDKVHKELMGEKNYYAAGYLGVDIDRLQELIERYTKPLSSKDTVINNNFNHK